MTNTTNSPTVHDSLPPYLDSARPIAERVRDLVRRLTLDEKIGQMCNSTPGIPRLNIPAYDYWSEGLHGVARNGRATVFPQAIGMAATWDRDLIYRVASAIGDEARAKYHDALRRKGSTDIYQGLTLWSPNINVFRDPRWGRGQETYGEDPYLTGELGSAFVRGLQGDHPKYLKAAACAKHFAVHSGPEKDRHTINVQVSPRDLHTTYLPAFKKLVTEAHVEAVMGAYNRVNDEACCASTLLLERNLRQEWGFEGHVVSDCGAINDLHANHKITADSAESAALAVKRGCDMSCVCTYEHLGEAVERGLITEGEIDQALSRTLATRFKLGMFDPPAEVPYAAIPMSVVNSPEHRQLAHEAAVKSVVLLKNHDNILPIRDDVKRILIVGPTAVDLQVLLGNYYGLIATGTTLLEGLVGRIPEGVLVDYRPGSTLTQPLANPHDWSTMVAAWADLTIACMGLSPLMEGEEGDAILSDENGDRSKITLPAVQIDYLKQIAVAGAKVVLVLTGGSPIALGELEDLMYAIVYVWYPGQEGGKALAEVLFGDTSPSGKLPVTFPASVNQLPSFEDYRMAGRTYRYSRAEPLYPFGFGLSYTTFTYSNLILDRQVIKAGETLPVHATLTNTGAVEAEEVVQLYISDLQASVEVPQNSLIGFQRLRLAPGERAEVSFSVTPEMMMLVDNEGQLRLEPGKFHLSISGCSPSERGIALGAPTPVGVVFTVSASEMPPDGGEVQP
ncbi:MAG TPA: glycoside hydrolase family 3 N-terminal domain-containing protein [Aggregatilineales bacterium]|nr:glycoside hydrolase family 3 N-terminal domain-containing protein [Aggregatilineales bacterium]